VSDEPDPERLLSEALRAQAVRAPQPAPRQPSPGDGDPVLKLLSGSDSHHQLLSGRASDTDGGFRPVAPFERPTVTDSGYTARLRNRPTPLSAWWIVLLAVLLGLAAGAVVGLISVV
jgi:hypothetical protein